MTDAVPIRHRARRSLRRSLRGRARPALVVLRALAAAAALTVWTLGVLAVLVLGAVVVSVLLPGGWGL